MSNLEESLNKFKQQQAKCQTVLKNTKQQRPNNGPSNPTKYSAPAKPQAAIKFSYDTERLQQVSTIRKSPVGAQIKRVIDLLLETRQAYTAEQINDAIYVDINGNHAVFESLKNNLKVKYNGKYFSYKPKHDLKDKTQLLELITKCPEGLLVVDVKDSYTSVLDDLKTLKAEGRVWILSNVDSQEDIVYPNDPKSNIKSEFALKKLFREIKLPTDMLLIEKDLQNIGMKPFTDTMKRRETVQVVPAPTNPNQKKKKKREITKRTKLTNAHLPELFQI
ncbi:putative Transcription initiation factor IIE subunit beta [Zostera marina]|uniref:Transcription initiation factor IIE subunit beta n=1 Tax=Zostera marina TaxID=29655 RepID=A0A0K9PZE2_ZOSMR|nr:putative Transcription initiation factor IIE subunit beta [Zostera marina]